MEAKTQNVRAEINGLEIGDTAEFPLARYDYVLSCRGRFHASTKKRYTSEQDKDRGVVIITRVEDTPE